MIRIYLAMRRGKLEKSEGLQLIAVLEKVRQALLADSSVAASIGTGSGRSASAIEWKTDPKFSRIRELLRDLAGPQGDSLRQVATDAQQPERCPESR